MSELRISRGAEADILEVWAYLFEVSSEETADTVTAEILRMYERLTEFPTLGRRRLEIGADFRSIPVGSYTIFYRVLSECIEIGRVLHQSRNYLAAFDIEEN